MKRRILGILAVLLSTTGLLAFLYLNPFPLSREKPSHGYQLIIDTLGDQRPLLPRLSGGFPHGPFPSGDEKELRRVRLSLEQLLNLDQWLEKTQGENVDAATFRARAAIQMLKVREPAAFQKADESLTSALNLSPEDPATVNDVAVIHLLRAVETDTPFHLVLALEAVEGALSHHPNYPEALFNRALILERLCLPGPARRAWQYYLDRDGTSPWAAEARQRMVRLSEPEKDFANSESQGSGNKIPKRGGQLWRMFEERLLDGFTQDGPGPEKIRRLVHELREIAGALARVDAFGETLLAALEPTKTAASPGMEWTQGFAAFIAGREALQEGRITEAEPLFHQAEAAFRAAGFPYALRAAYYSAVCVYRLAEISEARARFDALLQEIQGKTFTNLEGEILWHLGLMQLEQHQLQMARDTFRRGIEIYERLGNSENRCGLITYLGFSFQIIGEMEQAWDLYHQALSNTSGMINPRRLFQLYTHCSEFAWKQGHLNTALYFQHETVKQAELMKDPTALTGALLWRARYYQANGMAPRAKADAVAARRHFPGGDPRTESLLNLVESGLLLEVAPQKAVAALTSAIETYRSHDFLYPLPDALLTRGKARHSLGDLEGAEADFQDCIELYRKLAGDIAEDREKIAFYFSITEVFDALIGLQLQTGRVTSPMDVFEQRRERVLFERISRSWQRGEPKPNSLVEPAGWESWRLGLPEDGRTGIVIFRVTDLEVSAWIADRERVRFVSLGVSPDQLDARIRDFRQRLENNHVLGVKEVGRSLYLDLLQPLASYLRGYASLVLVPDGPLHRLPFGALFDGRQFLLERFLLSHAPSPTIFVACRKRALALTLNPGHRLLAFGNPVFDRVALPDLPYLSGAEEEARQLFHMFAPASELWLNEQATENRFLSESGAYEIVHFAGHARIVAARPMDSHLLLAPGENTDGILSANEIQDHYFEKTRLVVLSACESGAGIFEGETGMGGLARPFFAAGVPGIVASLWAVDDALTKNLMIHFFRELKMGKTAVEALRDAKKSFIAEESDGSVWAAFQLVGFGGR